ncbi:MAG: ATP-binding protein [Chloroflexota bacterium]|nr:ATP-binding protein [Chloroflexota bacterium]
MLTVFDEDRVLERVIDLTARALGAQRASLLLHPEYDAEWKNIFVRHLLDTDDIERLSGDQVLKLARRVLDQGLAGWVVRQKEGAVIVDTLLDHRWVNFPDSDSHARSALCVPFIYNGEALAVLTLVHDEAEHFTEHHLRLMTIVANQATIAVRNAQLFSRMLQQQRQLEAVLHAIPDLLMVLDESGSILLINEPAATLIDRPGDTLIGRSLAEFVTIDGVDGVLEQIQQIIQTPLQSGGNWTFEVRSERQKRDYLVSVSVWENPPAQTAGYVVVLRDVSTLRDLTRFKDEMLRIASHDLRSPLALIVGYCSLIELDIAPDSPINDYLQTIMRATERMKGLLDAMVRVEQIRKSPLEMHEHVIFAELVRQAAANMQMAIYNKQQQMDMQIHLEDAPGVTVNSVLLRECMENLISNASKYTPDGGRIIVRAYRHESRLIYEVEDNGIGIPKEHLPRLFQSFYRVKQPGTEGIEGRGQGLSLVKTVIERHAGDVWVESEPGVGSRFGFWIPI